MSMQVERPRRQMRLTQFNPPKKAARYTNGSSDFMHQLHADHANRAIARWRQHLPAAPTHDAHLCRPRTAKSPKRGFRSESVIQPHFKRHFARNSSRLCRCHEGSTPLETTECEHRDSHHPPATPAGKLTTTRSARLAHSEVPHA